MSDEEIDAYLEWFNAQVAIEEDKLLELELVQEAEESCF
jgi:hypothetical protein